jgi:small-conductance mechanosensitive channel
MTEWFEETLGLSPDVQGKLLLSAITILAIVITRWLALRAVQRRVEDDAISFRTRKFVTYLMTVLTVLVLGRIWIAAVDSLATYLGIVSAGIAIALSDVLKDLAGWMFIMLRRPLRLGDRVQIGDHSGDVIDIRALRFSLLEIGNWVDADQSTGRIVHVPNGLLFSEPMANYTEGFEYLWHEIPVLVTFESDWRRAERIMQDVLEEHAPDARQIGAEADIRKAARQYFIKYRHLTPIVYVTVRDSGVLLTGRLLVPARNRRGAENDVWRAILDGFNAEPTVELAYPTVRTFLPDPLQITDRPSG